MFSKHRVLVVTAVLLVAGLIYVAPGASSPSSSEQRPSGAGGVGAYEERLTALEARVTVLEQLLGIAPPVPTPFPTSTATPTATETPTEPPTGTTSPSPSQTSTSSPTATPPPTATSSPTTPPAGPTATPTVPPPPPVGGFPTVLTAGLPLGWTPVRTVTGDYTVSTPGAVVEDLRIQGGDLVVDAPDVTIRRVEVIDGSIDNFRGPQCFNGLVIEDTTIRALSPTTDKDLSAVGAGGYSADNVLIDGPSEGFRVGGRSGGCGPVTIANSYAHIVSPDSCTDWHGDGVQGYDGAALTLRRSVLVLDERRGCGGTAPFFYPHDQGNTSADISGLVVQGGGYPFRLTTPGSVQGLHIVDGWGYGPMEVRCSLISSWSADIVTLDVAGQPLALRSQPCTSG